MGPAPGNAVERWRARHLFKEGTPRTAMDALITTCSLLRREAVLAAGNFDARLAEGEDRELGQRMASAGYRVVLHPALHVISHKREKLFAMLARYRRWNHAAEVEIGWKEYARLCGYAVKSMVPADLRAGDPGAAAISLLCPHYQFWMSQDVNRPAAERACNATLELSKP
jgi:GT2 family glycosyltransferase